MLILVNGKRAGADALPAGKEDVVVCLGRLGQPVDERLPGARELGQIQKKQDEATRFENHDGFDYLMINVPDKSEPLEKEGRVECYYAPNALTVLYSDIPALQQLEEEWDARKSVAAENAADAGLLLYQMIARLTQHDMDALEDIEDEIAQLEDALIDSVPEGCAVKIGGFRKRLLALKRYYEALYSLLEDLEENANGLFTKHHLSLFHLQTNRAERLERAVVNLRDYVTQVRESYQSQLDISLNKTMKVFTVVTTIFLPLGLVVGWYGMNMPMPELSWPGLYPAVIALSVAIAAGCLWYFKKRRWF